MSVIKRNILGEPLPSGSSGDGANQLWPQLEPPPSTQRMSTRGGIGSTSDQPTDCHLRWPSLGSSDAQAGDGQDGDAYAKAAQAKARKSAGL
jgi:hypothetical protein